MSPEQQLLKHFDRISEAPDAIPRLRRFILDLAVRGKLVEQDPNDEPAEELLKRIREERASREGAHRRPGRTPTPANGAADAPLVVPASWRWVYVESCFEVSGGIQKTPARAPKDNPYPYVGVANVYRGRLNLSEIKQFELVEGELDRYRLFKGDILVVEGNGSAAEVGRCATWSGEIENCVHQNHVIRCRPYFPGLTPFVMAFLNSPPGTEIMKALAVTSAGLYNLSVGKIRSISFPVPPFAEQHRILAKVDELMALCDRLEAAQAEREKRRDRLLGAILQQALSPGA